jgi:hypothetical protein
MLTIFDKTDNIMLYDEGTRQRIIKKEDGAKLVYLSNK